ncbi:MAG: 23S rRNA (uracil(1939)-C(5))-methyltransferase RlmD [Kofleriaceae bacterium]
MPEMSADGKPGLFAVTATSLDDDGAGVAQRDGLTVHVAELLPGEQARVQVVHKSPHHPTVWARVVAQLGPPSPDRVQPACPAFGRCGGCPWQHLAYPAQLATKQRRVAAALDGLIVPEPVTPSPRQLGYRHKGKYVAGRSKGHLALGAWAPRSHDFVDTTGCRAVTAGIERARAAVVTAAAAAGLAPANERHGTGALRYVIIRQARGGDVLIGLVVRSTAAGPAVDATAAALAATPGVVGVVRLDNDRTDGGLVDGAAVPLVGVATLDDEVAGVPVALGATEFAQVNPAQADQLYAHVAHLVAAAPGERIADVYAGLGGIAFSLARAGAEVVAVERDRDAVAALTAAAARAELTSITARIGDATLLADGGPPLAAVVVNPPRKGCSPATLAAVSASAASRLVYVSCGPESLARDLHALVAAGWRVDHARPFDLMPGTAQVETIVRAVR